MNDFSNLEKVIVRELSCRLCLCTDVVRLKPLSAEIKRKIKRLFEIVVRTDDCLPKAICHDCLQQVSALHLYTVKVDKTQKFLEFHKLKALEEKRELALPSEQKMHPILAALSGHAIEKASSPPGEQQQGDSKANKRKASPKKKSAAELKFMEALSLEEFAKAEMVDKNLLSSSGRILSSQLSTIPAPSPVLQTLVTQRLETIRQCESESVPPEFAVDILDPLVLVDGRPAKQGSALDKQITLFYKMECCICHEKGFHFRSLMRHYKDRHGVPGYVTCCDKKFHYFYPKKIIEHMAYHLQPNIFMCTSCHQNFPTSQELNEHQANGGRSEGKIVCPRCSERYPTYRELGCHLVTHRMDKLQCDYCGKLLKHHHRKKTVNRMEDVILCSLCMRTLRNIEKHEKENKEKVKTKSNDTTTIQKYEKFKQAMGLSGDEDGSTD